ncbi:MAG: bifunctional glutamate N-acetyltransferase/amino-acid acetyltransferase ArgJ [Cucumibacter sp.]
MLLSRSPLAPAQFPDLAPVAGVRLFTGKAGVGYKGRDNVLLGLFDPGTRVAGVLTRSRCASAPVEWCRAHLGSGSARGLAVNAGNANAFAGRQGALAVDRIAAAVAELAGCAPKDVMLASTGVIGEPLDAAPVLAAIKAMLGGEAATFEGAANAIRTTDTFAKGAGARAEIDGVTVNVAGIAKGSGMIAPDMATLLAFVFTDMPVAAPVLRDILGGKVATSFNAITVDGDTSTSDTCLVFATGKAPLAPIATRADPRAEPFAEALGEVLLDLALQVVRDGEGASKLVTIEVTGADSDRSAEVIAKSIANSPLVKTAIAGEDANWGRIVMAVGKAGEPADRDRLRIAFGDIVVAEGGARSPAYDEAIASAYMKRRELTIKVDLGIGNGAFTAYTCDLTHGYISINGDYRS